ncbi:MAG: Pr6Pr family membrane protein [Clostridiales bacterium]|jgi:hypothetical protein|nr:Pr6Pr family membrane protein [Clostridiales bacterium]
MIRDKYVALVFRIAAIIWTILGLRTTTLSMLMYYTILSNMLALVMFVILAVVTVRDIRKNGRYGNAGYYPVFSFAAGIDLMLTLVGYWFLLSPTVFTMDGAFQWSFFNMTVHLFVPILCFLDFLLFSPNKSLKYKHVYYVVAFPWAYVLVTTIAGLLGHVYQMPGSEPTRFAYFFIDFDKIGAMVFVYIAVLTLFFLILGHLLYLYDSKVDKESLFRKKKS